MEFNEIKKEVKGVGFETLRTDSDNFLEAVVIKEELDRLNDRLKAFFGEPAWPSKDKLSFQAQETIKGFGGIMPGQTLYFKSEGRDSTFAMLWPWQDGKHTTVKIVRK
jgi:hypothetical protein